MAQPLRFGVVHDFRSPPGAPVALPDIYAQTMEQVEMVDQLGLDLVWFTEHHFLDDGHLPNFVPVAGAVAARTKRVRLSTDICLAPFTHPIRLAEDLAVLDNLSGGRMELGLGMGYAAHEFKGFGIPQSRRVSLTEETIEILRLAWTGEPFSYHGKRYHFDDVTVTPRTVQPGGPPLWIAAMKEAGALRAARYGTHLLPQGNRVEVLDPWRNALIAEGRDPADYRVGVARGILVTDDPERDWPQIRDAERYKMKVYERFFTETPDTYTFAKKDAQPIPQTWIVGDADHVVAEIEAFRAEYGVTDIGMAGLPPGIDPEFMAANLERIATEVLPRLR